VYVSICNLDRHRKAKKNSSLVSVYVSEYKFLSCDDIIDIYPGRTRKAKKNSALVSVYVSEQWIQIPFLWWYIPGQTPESKKKVPSKCICEWNSEYKFLSCDDIYPDRHRKAKKKSSPYAEIFIHAYARLISSAYASFFRFAQKTPLARNYYLMAILLAKTKIEWIFCQSCLNFLLYRIYYRDVGAARQQYNYQCRL